MVRLVRNKNQKLPIFNFKLQLLGISYVLCDTFLSLFFFWPRYDVDFDKMCMIREGSFFGLRVHPVLSVK